MMSVCVEQGLKCKPTDIQILAELLAKGDPACMFTCSKELLMANLPSLPPDALEAALKIIPVLEKQLGEPVELVEKIVKGGQVLILPEEDVPRVGQEIDWPSMEAIYPLFNMVIGLAVANINSMSKEELNNTLQTHPNPDFMATEVIKTVRRGCFDAESTVRIHVNSSKVSTVKLRNLKLGDRVESIDETTGNITFSEVYFIAHSTDDQKVELRWIQCRDKSNRKYTLGLSARHLMYASKKREHSVAYISEDAIPTRADQLSVNDYLWVKLKYKLIPCQIRMIRKYSAEVRHPLTKNHHILVNGVHASVHTISEDFYRILSAPLRWIYYYLHPGLNSSWLVQKLVYLVETMKEPFVRDEL